MKGEQVVPSFDAATRLGFFGAWPPIPTFIGA